MVKASSILLMAGCLLISCEQGGIEEELDPNGLYTPYLTSTRSDGEVLLQWGRPACPLCFGCPCPQEEPDYFEILFSDTDIASLRTHSTYRGDIYEAPITNLNNGQPYYFVVKAVISGRKYTHSPTVMTIPDAPEESTPIFEVIDRDVKYGSWSPDLAQVAYVRDNDSNNQSVFFSELVTNEEQLIQNNATSPEWSPNGEKVVYHTDEGEVNTGPGYRPTHIAVFDVEEGTTQRLTSGNSFNYLPSWSSDGEWIAYLSDQARGNEYNIWKIASGGGTPIQVTNDFNDLNTLASMDDRSPKTLTWSHDGSHIAFARLSQSNGTRDIYSVSINGGNHSVVVTSPWNDYCPAYSPDGSALAFISDRSGKPEIWTMDLESGNLRQVTGSAEQMIYENLGKIEWSPSGDKIPFTSSGENFLTLYSVEVN